MSKSKEIKKLKKELKLYKFDYLTGLKGRIDFEKRLRKNKDMYRFLTIVDINGLHQMNRSFGFSNGDLLINTVASILKGNSRKKDIYRIGGDEFAIFSKKTLTLSSPFFESASIHIGNNSKDSFTTADKLLSFKKESSSLR